MRRVARRTYKGILFGADFLEDIQRPAKVVHGDVQGGEQADLVLGGQAEDAALQALCDDLPGGLGGLDAHHQAQAGNALDAGGICQGGEDIAGAAADGAQEIVVQTLDDAQGTGAGHGVAAVGGAVVTGLQHILDLLAQERGTDGQAAAETLGGGDDVGGDAEELVGVELAGAAVAGLDLIDHQGDVIVSAELGGGTDEFGGQGIDTALALDAFQQDARGVQLCHGLGQGLDVVGLHMGEAGGQGLEILVEVVLARGGQGGQSPSVEEMNKADAVIVAIGAHDFILPIPGADKENVHSSWDVLSGKVELNGNCAVIGGGMVGTETAEFLLKKGCSVSIIEMMDKIANGESSTILPTILADFKAHNVQQFVNTKVSAIEAGAVKATQGEEEITIPCDMVVMAVGSRKNVFDVEGVAVPVYYAGDCSGERTASIAEAIRGGYKAANEI